jgi:hypothetical protein
MFFSEVKSSFSEDNMNLALESNLGGCLYKDKNYPKSNPSERGKDWRKDLIPNPGIRTEKQFDGVLSFLFFRANQIINPSENFKDRGLITTKAFSYLASGLG